MGHFGVGSDARGNGLAGSPAVQQKGALSLWQPRPVYSRIEAGTLGSFWSFVLLFAYIAGFEFGPGTLFAVVVNEILPKQAAPAPSFPPGPCAPQPDR